MKAKIVLEFPGVAVKDKINPEIDLAINYALISLYSYLPLIWLISPKKVQLCIERRPPFRSGDA